ncbi:MAG: MoaD/ThiS family protein [Bacillota bacterium]|nr:MoaD/ThiS family protein [Bacillota bacterium]
MKTWCKEVMGMVAAMKINGRKCKGLTVIGLLQSLDSTGSENERMLKKGGMVIINGRRLAPGEYGHYVIKEEDSIVIIPAFAGG